MDAQTYTLQEIIELFRKNILTFKRRYLIEQKHDKTRYPEPVTAREWADRIRTLIDIYKED